MLICNYFKILSAGKQKKVLHKALSMNQFSQNSNQKQTSHLTTKT